MLLIQMNGKFVLNEISPEQLLIVQNLKKNNVVVDAVAGSGKTTCCLHIAKYYSDKNFLLLTYNAHLKSETQQKVELLSLKNLSVKNYHSFVKKFYTEKCFTDNHIAEILREKIKPLEEFSFDYIIIDEAQDIKRIYFNLIAKIYNDNKIRAKFCILGDKNQEIYSFNGADSRYLTFAPELFNFNAFDWVKCKLTITHRISGEICKFINKNLLNEERLQSTKTGIKPYYIFNNYTFKLPFNLIRIIIDSGTKPEDILILAPSLKTSSVKKFADEIKNYYKNKISIYYPTNNTDSNEKIIQNKLIFSSFHQAKGIERKIVLILNFDETYFQFFNKSANPQKCPNELYVAATRASEQLYIFHRAANCCLPFLNLKNLDKNIHGIKNITDKQFTTENLKKSLTLPSTKKKKQNLNFKTIWCVTQLLKFLPVEIEEKCFNTISYKVLKNCERNIIIPSIVEGTTPNTFEDVAYLTGIAIPTMLEKKITGSDKILQGEYCSIIPAKLLEMCNIYHCAKEGIKYPLFQIKEYSWISREILDECINSIVKDLKIVTNNYLFSVEIVDEKHNVVGIIDMIDESNKIVYELKFVNFLQPSHYLQLTIYMLIHRAKNPGYKYILYNIRTGETVELTHDEVVAENVINMVKKNYCRKKLNDNEFLSKHASYMNKN